MARYRRPEGQMDRVRHLSIPEATSTDTLVEQHSAVASAIEAHDPDKAGEAMFIRFPKCSSRSRYWRSGTRSCFRTRWEAVI
jgi:DNA-binding GntR family transcriptional regulator